MAIQDTGSTSCALPPISEMMSPSGQACAHAPQPTHRSGSINGCNETGTACSFWDASINRPTARRSRTYPCTPKAIHMPTSDKTHGKYVVAGRGGQDARDSVDQIDHRMTIRASVRARSRRGYRLSFANQMLRCDHTLSDRRDPQTQSQERAHLCRKFIAKTLGAKCPRGERARCVTGQAHNSRAKPRSGFRAEKARRPRDGEADPYSR